MEHVMMSSNQRSSLSYSTDYNISYIFNIAHCSMYNDTSSLLKPLPVSKQ